MPKKKPSVEIRQYDGDLDEIVARDAPFHLEYMSDGVVWFSIGDYHVTLYTKDRRGRIGRTKIHANVEDTRAGRQ